MKRILAILMAVMLVCVAAANVFAAESPTSETYQVGDATVTELSDGTIIITIGDKSYTFDDIANHWGKDAIISAVANGLMIGYTDGKFHSEDGLIAAMVYTVLARIANADIVTTGDGWIESVVAWATTQGIADDTDPKAEITRQQMVNYMAKAAGIEGDEEAYAAWAKEAGIIIGFEDGEDHLGDKLTRAQFATILDRYVGHH